MNEYIDQIEKINSLQEYRLFYQSLISAINTKINESTIESKEWLEKFQWELFPELLRLPDLEIQTNSNNQITYSQVEERTQLLSTCFNYMSSMELLLFIDQFLKNFDLNDYEDFLGIFQWLDIFQWANKVLLNLRTRQFLSNTEDILSQLIITFKQIVPSLQKYNPKEIVLDDKTSNKAICFQSYISQKIKANLIELIQTTKSKIDLNTINLKPELSKEARIILLLVTLYSDIVSAEYSSDMLELSPIYFTQSITSHYKLIDLDSIQEKSNSTYAQIVGIMEPMLSFKNIIVEYLKNPKQCFDNSDSKIICSSIYFCFGLLISIGSVSHVLYNQSISNSIESWSISNQFDFNDYLHLSNQLIQCEDAMIKLGYVDVSILLRLKYLFNNGRPKQFHLDDNMLDFIMLINLYNNVKERKLNLIILKCAIAEYQLFDTSDQLSILQFSINNCNHLNLPQIKSGLISIIKQEDQINFGLDWLSYSHLLLTPINRLTLEFIHTELNYISLLINFYIYKFQKFKYLQDSKATINSKEHVCLIQSDLIDKLINLIKLIEAQSLQDIHMGLILESMKFNLERLAEVLNNLKIEGSHI